MKTEIKQRYSPSHTLRCGIAFGMSFVVLQLIGVLGLTIPATAFVDDNGSNPTIKVQLYNYSAASPALLVAAEREAGRIFGQAGLRVVWLECPVTPVTAAPREACQKAPEAFDIRLRVLAAPIHNKFLNHTFGFAINPTLASVYYEYALRSAQTDAAEHETPIILGCIIAHELGHLLLGPNSHSLGGIMQREWNPKQFRLSLMGGLVFTSQQSSVMRVEA